MDNKSGWLTQELLQRAAKFFARTVFAGDLEDVANQRGKQTSAFPLPLYRSAGGRKLAAYPDGADDNSKTVILFKCAKCGGAEFTDGDWLELACCAYVHDSGGSGWRYFLVNARPGERIELRPDPAALQRITTELIRAHYGQGWQRSSGWAGGIGDDGRK